MDHRPQSFFFFVLELELLPGIFQYALKTAHLLYNQRETFVFTTVPAGVTVRECLQGVGAASVFNQISERKCVGGSETISGNTDLLQSIREQ